MATNYLPTGHNTLTASLNVPNCEEALAFYARAFGARKTKTFDGLDGKPVHCEMAIGDSTLLFSEPYQQIGAVNAKELGGSPTLLTIYTPDADTLTAQALDAGCEVIMPLNDYPWGDRCSMVRDPYGYRWCLATHKEDVTQEEMAKRMAECEKTAGS